MYSLNLLLNKDFCGPAQEDLNKNFVWHSLTWVLVMLVWRTATWWALLFQTSGLIGTWTHNLWYTGLLHYNLASLATGGRAFCDLTLPSTIMNTKSHLYGCENLDKAEVSFGTASWRSWVWVLCQTHILSSSLSL